MPELADFAAGPDLAHAAVAQAALDAIARLDDHVEQLADAFLLAQTAGDALGVALTNVLALQQAVTDQGMTLAALQQTVSDQTATIADLQTTAASQGETITTLQGQVGGLETRLAALENPTGGTT